MSRKNLIATVLVFLLAPYAVSGQKSDEIFTIYLVRHAEKALSDNNPKDPPLSPCGEQRAESLVHFFEWVDLHYIYSTAYLRTEHTAKPIADKKGLSIKTYDPRELHDFAKLLIAQKEDALVVGHSNSTAVLAGLLAGEKLKAIDEKIYNRIYQVVLYKNTGRLHLLQSNFICRE